MSSLINLGIDLTKIDKSKLKDGKYLSLTISVNDTLDKYGNNASCFISQSKEEKEAKVKKTYLGNGKVVWTDGKITKAEKNELPNTSSKFQESDLPF